MVSCVYNWRINESQKTHMNFKSRVYNRAKFPTAKSKTFLIGGSKSGLLDDAHIVYRQHNTKAETLVTLRLQLCLLKNYLLTTPNQKCMSLKYQTIIDCIVGCVTTLCIVV